MKKSENLIQLTDLHGATNYLPLPIVIKQAEGVWIEDVEGNRYLDMLSAYSALNHGHRHPKLIQALKTQAEQLTLTSRAFYTDQLGLFYKTLADFTQKEKILPMNTGAEAVETAIKACRLWGYQVKQIPDQQAEIIVCTNNFHGRTITTVSLSSNHDYQHGFGPLTPGFRIIPYGDLDALEQAITPHTTAFLFEPIQGEAGVIVPRTGYLREAQKICQEHQVLFVADEIQTGFGRTGKRFACDWEQVVPDIYILGKALGGGILPISAIAADQEILNLFQPGSHGSTFGGNPLACAVAIAAINVLEEEQLSERSQTLGEYFSQQLRLIEHPAIKQIRGKGLFIGMELYTAARPYCEQLMNLGVLCKETHGHTIRFAPPLTIEQAELDIALTKIKTLFEHNE